MLDSSDADYIGEILESSTTQFTAQCRRLHEPPDYGSFVRMLPPPIADNGDELDPFDAPRLPHGAVYALVYMATTSSLEPNRRPSAFGLDETSLQREQPQIYDLLTTEFSGLLVGYSDNGIFRALLPPAPPRMHARVYACTQMEIRAITEVPDYLRTILNLPVYGASDELIAASLRLAYGCRNNDEEYLIRAGKEVASLLRDDYDRLNSVLRKLKM